MSIIWSRMKVHYWDIIHDRNFQGEGNHRSHFPSDLGWDLAFFFFLTRYLWEGRTREKVHWSHFSGHIGHIVTVLSLSHLHFVGCGGFLRLADRDRENPSLVHEWVGLACLWMSILNCCCMTTPFWGGPERQWSGDFSVDTSLGIIPGSPLCVEREMEVRRNLDFWTAAKWLSWLIVFCKGQDWQIGNKYIGARGPIGLTTECKDICILHSHIPESFCVEEALYNQKNDSASLHQPETYFEVRRKRVFWWSGCGIWQRRVKDDSEILA